MSGPPQIGQFEQLVLTAILGLRDDAYGVTIDARVVELSAPKAVSIGAVYVTLERMEQKGLVTSWLTDPTAARGAGRSGASAWRRPGSAPCANRRRPSAAFTTH